MFLCRVLQHTFKTNIFLLVYASDFIVFICLPTLAIFIASPLAFLPSIRGENIYMNAAILFLYAVVFAYVGDKKLLLFK